VTISGRILSRDEIAEVWTIDRSEVVDAAYELRGGALILRPVHYDVRGWPPGEPQKYTPILEACHDHGGWLYGLFDGRRLVGAVVLEGRFIGRGGGQLQLKFMHVSRAHRGRGLGQQLFDLARVEALRRGAKRLYVSATPSEHTIDFYLRLGCRVAPEPDAELLELEPEDIHLEYALTPSSHEKGGERAPAQGRPLGVDR
jgi:predicted N-acetyltransferase YhbS